MIRFVAHSVVGAALGIAGAGDGALHAQGRGAGTAAAEGATGTYELWVCLDAVRPGPDPGRCGPAAAAVAGHLVLYDRPVALEAVRDSAARHYLEHGYAFVSWRRPAPANGCYVLAPRAARESAGTYAGLLRAGLTRWHRRADGALEFPLYASPDAGYDVVVAARGGALVGEGRSRGFGYEDAAGQRGPAEAVVGRRVGPPDVGRCAAGAAAAARRRPGPR